MALLKLKQQQQSELQEERWIIMIETTQVINQL